MHSSELHILYLSTSTNKKHTKHFSYTKEFFTLWLNYALHICMALPLRNKPIVISLLLILKLRRIRKNKYSYDIQLLCDYINKWINIKNYRFIGFYVIVSGFTDVCSSSVFHTSCKTPLANLLAPWWLFTKWDLRLFKFQIKMFHMLCWLYWKINRPGIILKLLQPYLYLFRHICKIWR